MKTFFNWLGKEIREALPPALLFLFLFHMIALTKAVFLEDFQLSALRATYATIGALIIAKAILIAEALPIAHWVKRPLIAKVLWKTCIFGLVTLLFKFAEEVIPLISKHDGFMNASKALVAETNWPTFTVVSLWITGGLILYCLARELAAFIGHDKLRALLLGRSPD